jgi:hypothetical protein
LAYLSTQTDTLTLPSGPEWTVTMKRRVSGGDHSDALTESLAREEGAVGSRYQIYLRNLMPKLIVSWTLTDEQDRPLPITPQTVGLLHRADWDFLVAECEKRVEERPAEQEGPFVTSSGPRSTATKSKRRRSSTTGT